MVNLTYITSITFVILWSPEFSESLDRQGIHQLAAILQNEKKVAVFRHPSDGKVSPFLENLELEAIVISIRNFVPLLA